MTFVIGSVLDSVLESQGDNRSSPRAQKGEVTPMKYTAAFLLLVAAMSAQNAPRTQKRDDSAGIEGPPEGVTLRPLKAPRRLDIPAISREANGKVVSIVMSDRDGHPIAQGSGFVISKEGQVLTNYHVIKNGASAVIKFPDGAFFVVDGVIASDKDRDIATLKAHGNSFRSLTLGDSDRLRVGEEVVAIGNPLSLESTVSNGIVSGIRTIKKEGGEFLQITAPISPGSSGGPLFNMSGQVVGITTSHLVGGENLNFAIPINDVKTMLQIQLPAGYEDAKPIIRARPNEPETEAEPPEQAAGASLADTLRWMVESNTQAIEAHAPSFDSYMYIIPEKSSCQNFGIFVNVTYREGATRSAAKFIYSFDLGEVDPNSIREDEGLIKFRTTDDRDRIQFLREIATDEDHLKSEQLTSKDGWARADGALFVDDKNYRGRLTSAFKHAVILCGGKPSRF